MAVSTREALASTSGPSAPSRTALQSPSRCTTRAMSTRRWSARKSATEGQARNGASNSASSEASSGQPSGTGGAAGAARRFHSASICARSEGGSGPSPQASTRSRCAARRRQAVSEPGGAGTVAQPVASSTSAHSHSPRQARPLAPA